METQLIIQSQASQRDFPISLQGFSINNETKHNEDKYFAMNGRFFTWEKPFKLKTLWFLSLYIHFIFLAYLRAERKMLPLKRKKKDQAEGET